MQRRCFGPFELHAMQLLAGLWKLWFTRQNVFRMVELSQLHAAWRYGRYSIANPNPTGLIGSAFCLPEQYQVPLSCMEIAISVQIDLLVVSFSLSLFLSFCVLNLLGQVECFRNESCRWTPTAVDRATSPVRRITRRMLVYVFLCVFSDRGSLARLADLWGLRGNLVRDEPWMKGRIASQWMILITFVVGFRKWRVRWSTFSYLYQPASV